MKLGWMTDVHLDHLGSVRLAQFMTSLDDIDADALLITGDIADGNTLASVMEDVAAHTPKTVYFVLGNHDFWHGSIDGVRETVTKLCERHPNLVYLVNHPYVKLSDTCALVGHDGWYDALNGEWKTSAFKMIDWAFIHDYRDINAARYYRGSGYMDVDLPVVVGKSRALAEKAARHVEDGINKAVADGFKRIVVATHIPPFSEAHIFEGKVGDDDAQPWFTSALLGDVLIGASVSYPDNVFVSFSGHTHGSYRGQKTANLSVYVGGARYGHPELQSIIDV